MPQVFLFPGFFSPNIFIIKNINRENLKNGAAVPSIATTCSRCLFNFGHICFTYLSLLLSYDSEKKLETSCPCIPTNEDILFHDHYVIFMPKRIILPPFPLGIDFLSNGSSCTEEHPTFCICFLVVVVN